MAARFFNTAGPVNCEEHYCLPPLERWNLAEVLSLIDQKKYFVLHAPRQTGKTTTLLALMEYLNAQGKYRCLYINVEVAQTAREDVKRGIRAIMAELAAQSQDFLNDPFMMQHWTETLAQFGEDSALNRLLTLGAVPSTSRRPPSG